jgi:hypothetical protein
MPSRPADFASVARRADRLGPRRSDLPRPPQDRRPSSRSPRRCRSTRPHREHTLTEDVAVGRPPPNALYPERFSKDEADAWRRSVERKRHPARRLPGGLSETRRAAAQRAAGAVAAGDGAGRTLPSCSSPSWVSAIHELSEASPDGRRRRAARGNASASRGLGRRGQTTSSAAIAAGMAARGQGRGPDDRPREAAGRLLGLPSSAARSDRSTLVSRTPG